MNGERIVYGSDGDQPNFVLVEGEEVVSDSDQEDRLHADNREPGAFKEYPKKTKKKRGGMKRFIAVILIILLSGSAGFAGGAAAVQYYVSEVNRPEGNQTSITINPNEHINTAEAVAAKVIPSVVGISTTTEVVRQNIFGMQRGELVEGVGTGFIVSEDGYILTNSHVVNDGSAKTIVVQLTDGRELTGTVLWSDAAMDLAMVKVDANNLTAVEIGNSDEVNIGAYAVAIGNPFGLAFDRSVTQGVISGLNRTITVGSSTQTVTMEGLIQTDASINSGNSGGPLLNSKGQVIGINSAKAASGEGLGFAIPINTAKPIMDEVMETGTFRKAYMGIDGRDAALYLQYYPDANLGTETGVFVVNVLESSPADLAGIRQGDVITALEGKEIETMDQLVKLLFTYKPGDEISVHLFRDAKAMDLTLRLGTSPE